MKKNKIAVLLVAGVTIVSLVGLSGLFNLGPGGSNPSGQQQKKDDNSKVPCLFSEAFHIHPHLTILVDGKAESIPANIGILPGCIRELHTHDTDGIIHVEAAVDRGYVFADFLSVWGKQLGREGFNLKMTVSGKETTDPNFVLRDEQEIVLEYTKQ